MPSTLRSRPASALVQDSLIPSWALHPSVCHLPTLILQVTNSGVRRPRYEARYKRILRLLDYTLRHLPSFLSLAI